MNPKRETINSPNSYERFQKRYVQKIIFFKESGIACLYVTNIYRDLIHREYKRFNERLIMNKITGKE